MTTNPNPYSPPSGTEVSGKPLRGSVLFIRSAATFTLAWIVGIHLYSLYTDGFRIHNMLMEYSRNRWHWNLLVRLPYLALIQFALFILYARARRKRELFDMQFSRWMACLLGLSAGIFSTLAYDLIRVIPEDVFGMTISWTPHYVIIWVSYAVTTILMMETLFFRRRIIDGDWDGSATLNRTDVARGDR